MYKVMVATFYLQQLWHCWLLKIVAEQNVETNQLTKYNLNYTSCSALFAAGITFVVVAACGSGLILPANCFRAI